MRELTGLKARNIFDLLEILKNVPGSSIFYHTHIFLQQRRYMMPEHTNDFAYWVFNTLGEYKLGEELANIDLLDFCSIRAVREKLIAVIERNLFDRTEYVRNAPQGMEFEFIKSHSFILPTPYEVRNLSQFIGILRKITVRAIYYHVFEARLRLERKVNDFAYWIDTSLGDAELAAKISAIDPYTHTLETLRGAIIDILRGKR